MLLILRAIRHLPHLLPSNTYTGQTYVRFFHANLKGPYFYHVDWGITLLVFLVCFFVPVRKASLSMRQLHRLAANRARACLIVFVISIVGRVALLPIERFPEPSVHDEFSYLLGSDTLAHGRLANPQLPSWHHFEPFHVLMEPTYSTMYQPGFPMFLALGQRLFRTPRGGLLICAAAAAASLCWMLQTLVPPGWAFVAGLLVVIRINWFSYFGNEYWGGAAAILGGCLLVGSAMRIIRKPKPQTRHGLILALSLFLLMNTRPYEGVALATILVPWSLWVLYRRGSLRILAAGAFVFIAGIVWTGFYCKRVTGRLMFPQALQRSQWAITPLLLGFRPNHHPVYEFADQEAFYRGYEFRELYLPQTSIRGYLETLPDKLFREWYFYITPALTILLIGFVPSLRSRRGLPVMISFAALCTALAAEPFLQPQYVAVGAGVLYLVMINGVRWLRAAGRKRPFATRLLIATITVILLTTIARLVMIPTEAWPPYWGSRQREIPAYGAVIRYAERLHGKLLIFVRYSPRHFWGFSWINNGADVASQKVIWARDTEPLESNLPLICAYPGRHLLLLVPPESGYTSPPNAIDDVNVPVSDFLKPYTGADASQCARSGPIASR